MIALLVTGIGVFVAGLVTAAFGIPVKEFSFGNTLILSGAVIACTGLILISLLLVIRELRVIAQRGAEQLPLPETAVREGHGVQRDSRALAAKGRAALVAALGTRTNWVDRFLVAPLAKLALPPLVLVLDGHRNAASSTELRHASAQDWGLGDPREAMLNPLL